MVGGARREAADENLCIVSCWDSVFGRTVYSVHRVFRKKKLHSAGAGNKRADAQSAGGQSEIEDGLCAAGHGYRILDAACAERAGQPENGADDAGDPRVYQ